MVYIAVPTPSTPQGFDDSILRSVVGHVGVGKIAFIKSTVVPGTTRALQELFPDRIVLFSPEFLTEATAAHDVAHPNRNIVGFATDEGQAIASDVLAAMPPAPYDAIVRAEEAEAIKYGGNCWFYYKVLFVNMLYDMCVKQGIDYDVVKKGMAADPRIGSTHLDPVHQSGRGAGGHCFIKDFEAFRKEYITLFPHDEVTKEYLNATVRKNLQLLNDSGKDDDLVKGVYGQGKQLVSD